MTESHKGSEYTATPTSVTTERNRLMSWVSNSQELTEPLTEIPSPKIPIIPKTLWFVSKIANSILEFLAKLPYTLFKFGYEIAKIITRGLSRIRRLLFVAK